MNKESTMVLLLVQYIFPLIILLASAILYIKIAAHFNIIDKPNDRSSHQVPTIRGGGIIFVISTVLFFFWNNFSYPYLLLALLSAGLISFIDDIFTVNNRLKFSIHVISVLLIFKECNLLFTLAPVYLFIIAIIVIGTINAYNFMDGINGITGLYSLAIVIPLLLTESNPALKSLESFTVMGLLVFNIFNTRKKARCFAGDVGSITIAILIVFILISRIQNTNQFIYIGLLLLYGIDTVFTIIHRLYLKENIFKPHRKHLYQYLSNEKKLPHVFVSSLYAGLQFIINITIVFSIISYIKLFILFMLLSLCYWLLKMQSMRINA